MARASLPKGLPFGQPAPLAHSAPEVVALAIKLMQMHQGGLLGGAVMPEDARPTLPKDSADLFHYLTLGMSLNFQRNSYALWKAATAAFDSPQANWVFRPSAIAGKTEEELRLYLVKHSVALQPRKHVEIWRAIGHTIAELFGGDIRNLFRETENDVSKIAELVQKQEKKRFPYLSGIKIFNYWLYVLDTYTDLRLTHRELLNIAPDTHVVQASIRLGVVKESLAGSTDIQKIVSESWSQILAGTGISPIDMHTPLWLWSKGGFRPIVA
jgi:hypothetical protein